MASRYISDSTWIIILAVFIAVGSAHAEPPVSKSRIRQSPEYLWAESFRSDSGAAVDAAMLSLFERLWGTRSAELGRTVSPIDSGDPRVVRAMHDYMDGRVTCLRVITARTQDGVSAFVYFHRDDGEKLAESLIREIVEQAKHAKRAENEYDVAAAVSRYYWAYLLSKSPFIPLRADSNGIASIDPSQFVRKAMNSLINRIAVYPGDPERQRNYIRVPLRFLYRDYPVNALAFVYRDGRQSSWGRISKGEEYVEFLELRPERRFMMLPMDIVFPTEAQSDSVNSCRMLFRTDTLCMSIPVVLNFPWCSGSREDSLLVFKAIQASREDTAEASLLTVVPRSIKRLKGIAASRDFENLAMFLAQNGEIEILTQKDNINRLPKPIWAAVLNNQQVLNFYQYDGEVYLDMRSGEKNVTITRHDASTRIIWIRSRSHH